MLVSITNTNNATSRVLVVLEFESISSAFDNNSFSTYEAVFGYTTEIMTKAHQYGFEAYAEHQELPMEDEYCNAF